MRSCRNNMLHILVIFIVVCITTISCDDVESPGKKYFLKYYGEDGNQEAVDMIVNNDGTIILLGSSSVGNAIIIIKVDAEGNIEWQRKLGTSADVPKDIEPALNGNYIIVSDYKKATDTDIKLIRINNEGFKIDSVIHGTSENEHAKSVTPVSDGGFIVTGSTSYNWPDQGNSVTSQFYHPRCNSTLNFFDENDWTEHTQQANINVGTKFIQVDTDFYFFGYNNNLTANLNGKFLITYFKFDKAGANNTNVYLAGNVNNNNELIEDIETAFIMRSPASLSSYFIVSTSNKGTLNSRLRISKLRDPLNFKLEDDKLFHKNVFEGKRLEGVSAAPSLSSPAGFLVLANETTSTGEIDVQLSKFDQSGGELWAVNFGSEKSDKAAAVAELPDGRILVLCTIESLLQTKIALLKVNSKGQLLD